MHFKAQEYLTSIKFLYCAVKITALKQADTSVKHVNTEKCFKFQFRFSILKFVQSIYRPYKFKNHKHDQ